MKQMSQDACVWLIMALIIYLGTLWIIDYFSLTKGVLFTGGYIHHSLYSEYKK